MTMIPAEGVEASGLSAEDEFEREPVPERARLGSLSFVGMYAGEHCAGTELMIGPLFVASGVGGLRRGRRPDRRQPAGRALVAARDRADRDARAADALLPARAHLRAASW